MEHVPRVYIIICNAESPCISFRSVVDSKVVVTIKLLKTMSKINMTIKEDLLSSSLVQLK